MRGNIPFLRLWAGVYSRSPLSNDKLLCNFRGLTEGPKEGTDPIQGRADCLHGIPCGNSPTCLRKLTYGIIRGDRLHNVNSVVPNSPVFLASLYRPVKAISRMKMGSLGTLTSLGVHRDHEDTTGDHVGFGFRLRVLGLRLCEGCHRFETPQSRQGLLDMVPERPSSLQRRLSRGILTLCDPEVLVREASGK